MASWSLDLIGVPAQYRARNPFRLSTEEQIDAFPKLANADYVSDWIGVLSKHADGTGTQIVPAAWTEAVLEYVRVVQTKGGRAFIQDPSARNTNEHVEEFLRKSRRRVVKWIDGTNLLKRVIYSADHQFVRMPNSMIVRAHVHFRPIKDGIQIGQNLQNQKFFRTVLPWAHGNVWYRWLEYGISRIVWAAQGSTNAQLYYEIHCPHMPELTLVDPRNMSDKEFHELADNIWLPIVHSQRWLSTSNPRTWRF